jgi:hypothetical protein
LAARDISKGTTQIYYAFEGINQWLLIYHVSENTFYYFSKIMMNKLDGF